MHEKFVRLDKNDDKVKIKNESSSDDDNDSDFGILIFNFTIMKFFINSFYFFRIEFLPCWP